MQYQINAKSIYMIMLKNLKLGIISEKINFMIYLKLCMVN